MTWSTCCSSLLSNSLADCVNRYQLSVGHVFVLDCDEDDVANANWTREQNQEWETGIKVIQNSLWFFPVQESHSGNYSCYIRYENSTQ